jgi:hypothetical protein
MGGAMKPVGAVLVILGLLGLTFGGISYNKKETIAQIGDLKMQATEKRQLSLPPAVNGLAILVGAALWFRGGRKSQG